MNKELELWQFIAARLKRGESTMLLVVAESSGSSPGRQGYKMAIAADGEMIGSIGGGVMEVHLVEESRRVLRDAERRGDAGASLLREQVHREKSPNASGMICSGKQTVIMRLLTATHQDAVDVLLGDLRDGNKPWMVISEVEFKTAYDKTEPQNCPLPSFERIADIFNYIDKLGLKENLYIIGGGHCALALSELMSKMDFHITLLDDRPELNTIAKNEYAHDIKIVDSYDRISDHVSSGQRAYVVVMTLGYKTDEQVVRSLINGEFKYFGVLGSKAKMATMLATLRKDGIPHDKIDRIRTPIGLPINSRTPEEIAISIAAEIISVKNG